MPNKDPIIGGAEYFSFSGKPIEVEAQHLTGNTEHHKGIGF